MCGENVGSSVGSSTVSGSSPRVRGKPRTEVPIDATGGLIPACAGKTRADQVQFAYGQAHPRVCGENSAGAVDEPGDAGSSPRVRGKLTCPSL